MHFDTDNLVVVSPDVGRAKAAKKLSDMLGCDLAIAHKGRPRHNAAEVMGIIGDIKGKTCIINDDMIDTAGTLCANVKELKAMGAGDIYVCATHGIFSGPGHRASERRPHRRVRRHRRHPRRGRRQDQDYLGRRGVRSGHLRRLPRGARLHARRRRLRAVVASRLASLRKHRYSTPTQTEGNRRPTSGFSARMATKRRAILIAWARYEQAPPCLPQRLAAGVRLDNGPSRPWASTSWLSIATK